MNKRLSPQEIETAKSKDLVELVSRHVKLRRRGREFWGLCPFHQERRASFHVIPDRGIYKCFACGAGGDAITWIRETERLGFAEAVARLSGNELSQSQSQFKPASARETDKRKRRSESRERAIWKQSVPIKGTHAEAYLRARGIRLPPSEALRFHPRLFHSESEMHFPALVALLSDADGFCAIQRTFLDPSQPKKAPVEKAKLCLGSMGSSAVRLRDPHGDILGIAEGIETALSASQIYAMPVWAVCGAHRLAKIEIPSSVRCLHIFGDPGEIGREFAFNAADEWEQRGLSCEVYFPEAHFAARHNDDFNDVLRGAA